LSAPETGRGGNGAGSMLPQCAGSMPLEAAEPSWLAQIAGHRHIQR
jgi:hypothetical protein